MRGRARQPEVALRRHKALKLRQAGASYADLARALDYPSEKHARTDVSRALRTVVQDTARETIALEQSRLDALQLLAWRLAEKGDTSAIRESVRILERRAKLLGLDGQRDDDGLEEATSLLARIDAGLRTQYAAGDLDAPPADDPAT